jgi:hypothetical protein
MKSQLSSTEASLLDFLKSSKPSTAKDIAIAIADGVRKTEVNSVLYSLLKKGLVKKTGETPPIWSIVRKRTKYLVIVSDECRSWFDTAAKFANQELQILFYTDRDYTTVPIGIQKKLVNIRTPQSLQTKVVIDLTLILAENNDVEIVIPTVNNSWTEVLTQLDETFGVKWKIISPDWPDVWKQIE